MVQGDYVLRSALEEKFKDARLNKVPPGHICSNLPILDRIEVDFKSDAPDDEVILETITSAYDGAGFKKVAFDREFGYFAFSKDGQVRGVEYSVAARLPKMIVNVYDHTKLFPGNF